MCVCVCVCLCVCTCMHVCVCVCVKTAFFIKHKSWEDLETRLSMTISLITSLMVYSIHLSPGNILLLFIFPPETSISRR